jgi:hypothetical protein
MSEDVVVLPAEAPRTREMEAAGWVVAARSFGAQLDAAAVDLEQLGGLVDLATTVTVRQLEPGDVDAVLVLDAATAGDYPGSVATQHQQLDRSRATPSAKRRAYGAFLPNGALVGMPFLNIDGTHAETDFTVVGRPWRGKAVGTAVKAASVIALLAEGIETFRTGGSTDNAAIRAANDELGCVTDEEWVTLTRTDR